jgi:hypothetical protein
MFEGETVSHVLGAVLTRELDLTGVPPSVRHLLTRCLQKDPRKRFTPAAFQRVFVAVA